MPLPLAKAAQAKAIFEICKSIITNLPEVTLAGAYRQFLDDKIRIQVSNNLVDVKVWVIVAPNNEVLVYHADVYKTYNFRHTARWITYLDGLLDDAQDIVDAEAADAEEQVSTYDDEDIFDGLTPSAIKSLNKKDRIKARKEAELTVESDASEANVELKEVKTTELPEVEYNAANTGTREVLELTPAPEAKAQNQAEFEAIQIEENRKLSERLQAEAEATEVKEEVKDSKKK